MKQMVLITRPVDQAQKTAQRLNSLDITSHIDPMLIVEHQPISINEPVNYQAILITSANAVHALKHFQEKQLVYTVGDTTAETVKTTYPIHHVINANGTGHDLALLAAKTLSPQNGLLLYISGETVQFDLAEYFKTLGFEIDRIIAYATHPATDLLKTSYDLLKNAELHSILFYSQRTAETFANIVKHNKIEQWLKGIHAQTLSENVAKTLVDLPFERINVAKVPTEEALITQLQGELLGNKRT